jgi:transposase
MAQPNWVKIRARYERGGISQRDLAASEGVSYNTLKDRSKREGWAVSRDVVHSKTTARTQQLIVERGALKAADVVDLATDFYLKALDKAQQLLEMADTPKDVKATADTAKIAVDGLRQALGITAETPTQATNDDQPTDYSKLTDAELADKHLSEARRTKGSQG